MTKRKLPKNPKKGERHTILVNSSKTNIGSDRLVTLEATGKKGFGKWKIVRNVKADKNNLSKAENIQYGHEDTLRGHKGSIQDLQKHEHRRGL